MKIKPGDLLEWNREAFHKYNYTLCENDARSPFLFLRCSTYQEDYYSIELEEVEVLDSRGKKMRYEKNIIEKFARKIA